MALNGILNMFAHRRGRSNGHSREVFFFCVFLFVPFFCMYYGHELYEDWPVTLIGEGFCRYK